MSWSQTIKLGDDGSVTDEQFSDAARGAREGELGADLAERRGAIVDAQIAFARTMTGILGKQEERPGSITIQGHVDEYSTSASIAVEAKTKTARKAKEES